MTASRKDWVKQYSTIRLVTAAEKSGKFSAAATAYAALVARDPKAAENAKPGIPEGKAELPGAINAVKTALGDAKLKPEQKSTLQAFLAELYIANGQPKEAEALGGKAAAPTATGRAHDAAAGTPAARGNAPPPAANKGQLDLKLQLAVASLKQKKYQEAIDAVDSVAASLTDPDQQADALFCVAEAKDGLAGDDAAKLKDAALAYMRVVAHFRSQPQAPHVPESLLGPARCSSGPSCCPTRSPRTRRCRPSTRTAPNPRTPPPAPPASRKPCSPPRAERRSPRATDRAR